MCVALREVYGKSGGKILPEKLQACRHMLLNVNAMIYCKFKLQLTFRNKNYPEKLQACRHVA
jgi:hypothetical protein